MGAQQLAADLGEAVHSIGVEEGALVEPHDILDMLAKKVRHRVQEVARNWHAQSFNPADSDTLPGREYLRHAS